MIDALYLISGLLLPLFYVPQILRILTDDTMLSSYSMSKSFAQFILRLPTLLFAVVSVESGLMIFVLSLDLLGRAVEVVVSFRSLRLQGCSWPDCWKRTFPLEYIQRVFQRRPAVMPQSDVPVDSLLPR